MDQGKSGGMEGGPGDQRQVFDTIEPIANEGAANGSHMNPKLMGPACFGPEPQQGKGPLRFQNLIMGHSRGTVRADHPSDGRTRVPSGWHKVFTPEPPFVPWPALTQMVIPFRLSPDALYRIAFPELILENSAYFQEESTAISLPFPADAPSKS